MSYLLVDRQDKLTGSVTLVGVDGHTGLVNGNLLKVGTRVSVQLSVQVRVHSSLEERVLGNVNTADEVTRLKLQTLKLALRKPVKRGARIYHDLLSLGEVVARVAVQSQLSERRERNNIFGHNLGGVKKIESEPKLVFLLHDLSLKLNIC